jgi:hypothetical protein
VKQKKHKAAIAAKVAKISKTSKAGKAGKAAESARAAKSANSWLLLLCVYFFFASCLLHVSFLLALYFCFVFVGRNLEENMYNE